MTTGFFAPKVKPATLAVTQMAISTAALLIITPLVVPITFDLPWQAWAAIVWTALTGTVYAFFIQSWAQRYTTSTHAAILLGFEAVFAVIAGIAFGMDSVTWRLLVGGSMMLTGVFIVELLPSSKGVVEEIEAEAGLAPLPRQATPATDHERGGRSWRDVPVGAYPRAAPRRADRD